MLWCVEVLSTVGFCFSLIETSQSTSAGQCFSNPSYHTVAQCNISSSISNNLDGNLTLKVSTNTVVLPSFRTTLFHSIGCFWFPPFRKETRAIQNGELTAISMTWVSVLTSFVISATIQTLPSVPIRPCLKVLKRLPNKLDTLSFSPQPI